MLKLGTAKLRQYYFALISVRCRVRSSQLDGFDGLLSINSVHYQITLALNYRLICLYLIQKRWQLSVSFLSAFSTSIWEKQLRLTVLLVFWYWLEWAVLGRLKLRLQSQDWFFNVLSQSQFFKVNLHHFLCCLQILHPVINHSHTSGKNHIFLRHLDNCRKSWSNFKSPYILDVRDLCQAN